MAIPRRPYGHAMTHPITGVRLNPLTIERVSLDFKAAVTAWVMRLQGEKYAVIAQRLGTNTFRLGEVYNQEIHPDAQKAALILLTR